ncbi:MAG: GDSL-type esterase/lipase family protein, partial [Archangium sp.]
DFSTENGPTYVYPGTTVRFRCNCTGVDVAFADKGGGGEEHTNWVNVLVDGQEAVKVELEQEASLLRGARNLKKGEHTIEIVKRTGPHAGAIQFLGVSLQGILLDPPAPPPKKMEFIGDSLTCGYGDEVRIYAPTYTEPNTGYHSKNEDISKAYGSLVARRFNAEAVTTCILGRGVYRNIDGSTDLTMPSLYTRLFPDQEEPLWKPQDYVPDVIVINLGTSDFNALDDTQLPSAPPAEPFEEAYAAFVQQLRVYYPDAKIICAVGPMVNDYYPSGRKLWTFLQQDVHEMVQSINDSGDPNVYYFDFLPLTGDAYGEDWHPTAEAHAKMADELSTFLQGHGI